jgi:ABC-type multidrug transport system fused ATPase/permease subunit
MSNFTRKYVSFFTKYLKAEKDVKLLEVDFDKPWWDIIFQQKIVFGLLLILVGLVNFYDSIIMIWISQALDQKSLSLLTVVILGRVLIAFLFIYVLKWNPIFQLNTVNSVNYSATKRVLEVDPIFHTTKSSGVMISKINKGSSSFEGFLDVVTHELFAILIGVCTTVFALTGYNFSLGVIAAILIGIMITFNIFSAYFNNIAFKDLRINSEDNASQTSIES